MRIVGLVNGTSHTAFDGKYLVDYDAERDGIDPATGLPTIAHIAVTDDPARALVFDHVGEGLECWRRVCERDPVRPDGQPNRPLTAFTVEFAPLT